MVRQAAEEFVMVRRESAKAADIGVCPDSKPTTWAAIDCNQLEVESLPESPRSMDTFISEDTDEFVSISLQQKESSLCSAPDASHSAASSPATSLVDVLQVHARSVKRDLLRNIAQFLGAKSVTCLSSSSTYLNDRLVNASYMDSLWRKLFLTKYGKGKTDKRHQEWKNVKSRGGDVRCFWRTQYMKEYALQKREEQRKAQREDLNDMMTLREQTNEDMQPVGSMLLSGLSKEECRAHYKSIRSKPQGKRGKGRGRTHDEPYYDAYSY